ncbi:MAG: hypothetical protein R3F56_04090 [Planctomycetota bacterium]
MASVCVKISQIDWSSGDPEIEDVSSSYPSEVKALQARADTEGGALGTTLAAKRQHCLDVGTATLGGALPNGWSWDNTEAVENSSTGGGGSNWDPLEGGVAFRVFGAGDEELWVEFFPCKPIGILYTLRLNLCNDSGGDASGLALEFMPGRTRIQRARIDIDENNTHSLIDTPTLKGWWFDDDLPAGSKVELILVFEFDVPSFRIDPDGTSGFFVTWLSASGTPIPPWNKPFRRLPSPLLFDRSAAASHAAINHALLHHEATAQQIVTRRNDDIDATQGVAQVYKVFFLRLDVQTNPDLGGQATTTHESYFFLKRILQARMLVRAQHAASGATAPLVFSTRERDLVRKAAAAAAHHLQSLVVSHFGSATIARHGAGVPNFEEALDMFASGALTSFDAHGAPDGALVLTLGEFVLLLRELVEHPPAGPGPGKGGTPPPPVPASKALPIDWNFWQPLERVMCRTAEIFARCYHLPGAPANVSRTVVAYTPLDNPNGRRGLDPHDPTSGAADASILHDIRGAWAKADPAKRFGETVAAALLGELSPPPAPPSLPSLDDIKPHLSGRKWTCSNEMLGPRDP